MCGFVITRFAFVKARFPKQRSPHPDFSATSLSPKPPRCLAGPGAPLMCAALPQRKLLSAPLPGTRMAPTPPHGRGREHICPRPRRAGGGRCACARAAPSPRWLPERAAAHAPDMRHGAGARAPRGKGACVGGAHSRGSAQRSRALLPENKAGGGVRAWGWAAARSPRWAPTAEPRAAQRRPGPGLSPRVDGASPG